MQESAIGWTTNSTFFFSKNDMMIPGSNGQEFDAGLLAGEFLTLGPAKNRKVPNGYKWGNLHELSDWY